MSGSIHLRDDVKHPYWEIFWYEKGAHGQRGKQHKISSYYGTGERMFQMHPDPNRDIGYHKAGKLLSMIQADYERYMRGEAPFDIRKYKDKYTDVIPFVRDWLRAIDGSVGKGTLKNYTGYINNHIIPFFERHPLQLHEIQKDSLMLLMQEIQAAPKTRKNVLDAFKTCMVFAYESRRIPQMPIFPKEGDYQIRKKPPVWITGSEQDRIFKHIPDEDMAIFMFLRLHWRRAGEAIALHKEDYDPGRDVFVVHRGIECRKVVDKTKDGQIHVFPCHPDFKPYLEKALKQDPFSPFLFTCKTSRMEGKRYTREILMDRWTRACGAEGIKIDIHRGLRTSGASSAINEGEWSIEEAQAYGQWSRRETVEMFYGRYEIDRLRALQTRGKVISLKRRGKEK